MNPCIIWFTGLPSSGKSTLAKPLYEKMRELNIPVVLLDGDDVRRYVSPELSYTIPDRIKQMWRLYGIAKLLLQSDVSSIICTNSSPFVKDKNIKIIYIDCTLEECKKRDVKHLYERASKGEIKNLPGIDLKYYYPLHPFLTLRTNIQSIDECTQKLIDNLLKEGEE